MHEHKNTKMTVRVTITVLCCKLCCIFVVNQKVRTFSVDQSQDVGNCSLIFARP